MDGRMASSRARAGTHPQGGAAGTRRVRWIQAAWIDKCATSSIRPGYVSGVDDEAIGQEIDEN